MEEEEEEQQQQQAKQAKQHPGPDVRIKPAIAPCLNAGPAKEEAAVVADHTPLGEAIQADNVAIVYENLNNVEAVVVKAGKKTRSRYGSFLHDDWIGQRYGSKVYDKKKKVWWRCRVMAFKSGNHGVYSKINWKNAQWSGWWFSDLDQDELFSVP